MKRYIWKLKRAYKVQIFNSRKSMEGETVKGISGLIVLICRKYFSALSAREDKSLTIIQNAFKKD
jgi:hypothetical protein